MRYSKRIEREILELKGGDFFLSPRDREFLRILQEQEIPEEVAMEGIRRCLLSLPPSRRRKTPLFLCYGTVVRVLEEKRRISAYTEGPDWRERFRRKVALVRDLLEDIPPFPKDEETAKRVLREIEDRLLRKFWRKIPKEERERILERYRHYKRERELYRELLKREIQRRFGLPDLSLYVD